ncbi:MAG: ABC transporter permease subunit [Desulfomonile tiedjei]|nr:ABC transporter permease subunit [Desulfomonile tiedjei]
MTEGASGVRRRSVRRSVLVADRIADQTIRIGGVLVIAAVLGILVFLVYEVVPLFKGGTVQARQSFALQEPPKDIAALTLDEYKVLGVTVAMDGSITAFHARTGASLHVPSLDLKGKKVTAVAKTLDRKDLAFGFSDGTVRFARVAIEPEIIPAAALPQGLTQLSDGDSTDGVSVFSVIPGDQIRKVTAKIYLSDEIQVSKTGSPIVAMDYRSAGPWDSPRRSFVTVDGQGVAALNRVVSKKNLLTGKVSEKVVSTVLPQLPQGAPVSYALLTDNSDEVYLAEKRGRVYRYNTRNPQVPVLAETVDLLPRGVELTTFGFLLGEKSLVVGGSNGWLGIFFRLRQEEAGTPDGYGLVLTRKLEPQPGSITGLDAGQRGRLFVTTDGAGDIWVRHATSQRTLLRLQPEKDRGRVTATAFAPRGDGVLALQEKGGGTFWDLSIPHPETSLGSLFGKVWYEGYPEPSYTWQSSGATDDFEPKLSLVPLIFGTLKATFYSLMFAIPIALLAAVYTSEFVHPSVRATVKPIMEMMASLPSVILGFVVALVLAPVVESWIAAVILAFVVVPLALVFAAHLWQMVPAPVAIRLEGLPKLIIMFLCVAGAGGASYAAGPLFERLFFAGNIKAWLNGGVGSAAPFLFLLLMPPVFFAMAMVVPRWPGQNPGRSAGGEERFKAAALELVRWLGLLVAAAGCSYALALLLQEAGVDARGGFIGTYVQRNTLLVGFAMGFAVIPITYTLAEDALNAVPDHLRFASLSCGATPWQTAIWVILPTAASGVFAAIMIGMGRAVGETMIVVMASGNTPLLDLNVFDGLRALSANIAVELPEAVKDGSLYRVLFLTALVLFSMTFVINTVAEVVRLRFRKRAMQL